MMPSVSSFFWSQTFLIRFVSMWALMGMTAVVTLISTNFPSWIQEPIMQGTFSNLFKIMIWVSGYKVKRTNMTEVDYSKYLGKGWTQEFERTNVTIIFNHTSFLEILMAFTWRSPTFISTKRSMDIPLVGTVLKAINAIFLERSGENSPAARQEVNQKVTDYQNRLSKNEVHRPLLTFPEGSTSNGDYLMQFIETVFVG